MIVKHQKAFSMLTSIIVVIIMATIGISVMNLGSKIVQETTTQYRREQAALLAKSYTEFAIMAVTANDRSSSNCIKNIIGDDIISEFDNGQGYQVQTMIYYIGNNTTANLSRCNGNIVLANDVTTVGSDLQIIVDVYVSYKDPDNNNNIITYHRRTLQKI
jgi:Tfp pilus assembly protein PilV